LVVYGVLRTAEAVSPLSSQQVATSLIIIVLVYFLVFGTGTYYMFKLMARGPDSDDRAAEVRNDPVISAAGLNHRPMARASEPIDD